MNAETILTFTAVAWLAIISPGPAILLAIRNSVAFGVRSVIWSSIGNVSGIFFLSTSAMLGLGVVLKSSAILFDTVKILGALYLFYVGIRHLVGRCSIHNSENENLTYAVIPRAIYLYKDGFLLATTNPKPILFFTALFPQFINTDMPLLPQFFILTGIFMLLSFITLLFYANVASVARSLLIKPHFLKWINRVVGGVFISFGVVLLTLGRPTI